MTDIRKLLRPNIASIKPYSSARHEYSGTAEIYLDANENPYPGALNRYPDPLQLDVKRKVSAFWDVPPENIFLGNGSDEAIDLLIRAFCRPGNDSIVIMPPTYGMYKVCADINDVEVLEAPLNGEFNIDISAVEQTITQESVKIIFVCSPNNPTGGMMDENALEAILAKRDHIVVLDEAYADFSTQQKSIKYRLDAHPNLVILRTFSKAWGMAGARLGMAFASQPIIDILNSIKPPYNINTLTQKAVTEAMSNAGSVKKCIQQIVSERTRITPMLKQLNIVQEVFPSEANFLLVRFENAKTVFSQLLSAGIVVRDRTTAVPGCLRITIGTPEENEILLNKLKELT